MTNIMHGPTAAANPTVGRIEQSCGLGTLFRALWPFKTAAQLAGTARISRRKAEYILAGARSLSGDDVASLLRSEHGADVLKHLMAGARPTWWRDMRRQIELSDLRKRQEEQRALIERLEREAAE